jgi:hypothetical protein
LQARIAEENFVWRVRSAFHDAKPVHSPKQRPFMTSGHSRRSASRVARPVALRLLPSGSLLSPREKRQKQFRDF